MERRWLKASEIGTYLGIATKTVYDLCSKGVLPSVKLRGIGRRIDVRRVDELLEKHEFQSILEQLEG